MTIYPKNKYLVISSEVQKEQKKQVVLLPEDYNKNVSGPKVVRLERAEENSTYFTDCGQYLIVQSHLIETLEWDGNKVELIPEHAVYGIAVQ